VELLLAVLRPWQLMAGKIIGIGIVGLLQFAIIGGVGLAGALATDLLTLPPASAAGTLVAALAWYAIGFFLFAAMLAAAAALVSRQEDVTSVVQPVMVAIAATFVVSIALLTDDPDDPLVEILSVVPPFSPVLMPARAALGSVPIWQTGVSVALAAAAVAALAWWGGKIYAYAVLRTGARVTLTEVLRNT
jgi:ABC-2 type transport system permease protein